MTYETYRMIYMVALIACIAFFIIALILFFTLKIPKIVGELSGATARKAIKNIREQNESSGEKEYKTGRINRERGKLTDKISPSGNLIERNKTMGLGIVTEKISTQSLSNETTILGMDSNETTILNSSNETTVLNQQVFNETTVLSQADYVGEAYIGAVHTESSIFEILYEITFIHTNEMIM